MHDPPAIPGSLVTRLAGWTASLAYSYGPQTATWRLSRGVKTRYLKLVPSGFEPSLARERDRMRWARGRLPVPRALDHGVAGGTEWLLTSGLRGVPATDPALASDPRSLVPVLARGLARLHDTPAGGCPFDSRTQAALANARRRVAAGLVDAARDFHPEHAHFSPEEALAALERTKPESDDVVLCHGDYCLPNVLVEGDRVVAYLDLGELALADRWWDLAVATWSVTWNLGPGWEDAFLEAYGATRDAERTRFFRLLYDLSS